MPSLFDGSLGAADRMACWSDAAMLAGSVKRARAVARKSLFDSLVVTEATSAEGPCSLCTLAWVPVPLTDAFSKVLLLREELDASCIDFITQVAGRG